MALFSHSSRNKPLPDGFGSAFSFVTQTRKSLPKKDDPLDFERLHSVRVYPIAGNFSHNPRCANLSVFHDPDDEALRNNTPLILQRMSYQISRKIVEDPHHKDVRWLTYRESDFYGRKVKIKSTRLEAMAKVVAGLIKYMSLTWGMVGNADRDDPKVFRGYTVPWLASQCGVSVDQFKRVTQILRRKGAMIGKNLCEIREDGSYKGKAGLKYLTAPFFKAFGFDKWLPEERRKAQERDKKSRDVSSTNEQLSSKEKAVVHMSHIAAMNVVDACLGTSIGGGSGVLKPRPVG